MIAPTSLTRLALSAMRLPIFSTIDGAFAAALDAAAVAGEARIEESPGDHAAEKCAEEKAHEPPRAGQEPQLRLKDRHDTEQNKQGSGAGRDPEAQNRCTELGIDAQHQSTPPAIEGARSPEV